MTAKANGRPRPVGYREPAPGPTETVKAVPNAQAPAPDPKPKDPDDVTGRFQLAVEELEATYDACRARTEKALRRVAQKR